MSQLFLSSLLHPDIHDNEGKAPASLLSKHILLHGRERRAPGNIRGRDKEMDPGGQYSQIRSSQSHNPSSVSRQELSLVICPRAEKS